MNCDPPVVAGALHDNVTEELAIAAVKLVGGEATAPESAYPLVSDVDVLVPIEFCTFIRK
jgi:hypothetical protein